MIMRIKYIDWMFVWHHPFSIQVRIQWSPSPLQLNIYSFDDNLILLLFYRYNQSLLSYFSFFLLFENDHFNRVFNL